MTNTSNYDFPETAAVSVILPVFNRRHLIMRAIDSVENQTFQDWELLIVDDGSTDGLEELVIARVLQKPKWRYLKHANRRLSASRNIGIHAALGKYVTFLDSDDEYRPDHLQIRVQYMQDHPGVSIIHGGVELVGPPETHYVQDAFNPGQKIHLSECTIGATLFGLKSVFVESGGFKKIPYSAESEFLPRVVERFKVDKVDFPTYVYYTGLEDSICTMRKNGLVDRNA